MRELTAIFGDNTAAAYVERQHLNMRQAVSRFARKTLAFSRKLKLHHAAIALDDALHNFIRPQKHLRVDLKPQAKRFERRYHHRTPAMAAGLTHRVWSLEELLRLQVVPNPLNS